MKHLALCVFACLILGNAVTRAQGNDGADQSAYEQGYRMSFRASGIQACVASVKGPVPEGIDVPAICACSMDWMLAHKTVAELKQPPTEEDHQAVRAACFKAGP